MIAHAPSLFASACCAADLPAVGVVDRHGAIGTRTAHAWPRDEVSSWPAGDLVRNHNPDHRAIGVEKVCVAVGSGTLAAKSDGSCGPVWPADSRVDPAVWLWRHDRHGPGVRCLAVDCLGAKPRVVGGVSHQPVAVVADQRARRVLVAVQWHSDLRSDGVTRGVEDAGGVRGVLRWARHRRRVELDHGDGISVVAEADPTLVSWGWRRPLCRGSGAARRRRTPIGACRQQHSRHCHAKNLPHQLPLARKTRQGPRPVGLTIAEQLKFPGPRPVSAPKGR
jgi:hypothetical protein